MQVHQRGQPQDLLGHPYLDDHRDARARDEVPNRHDVAAGQLSPIGRSSPLARVAAHQVSCSRVPRSLRLAGILGRRHRPLRPPRSSRWVPALGTPRSSGPRCLAPCGVDAAVSGCGHLDGSRPTNRLRSPSPQHADKRERDGGLAHPSEPRSLTHVLPVAMVLAAAQPALESDAVTRAQPPPSGHVGRRRRRLEDWPHLEMLTRPSCRERRRYRHQPDRRASPTERPIYTVKGFDVGRCDDVTATSRGSVAPGVCHARGPHAQRERRAL